MVECYNDLVRRVSTCFSNKKQREIYFEEDAENYVLMGDHDILQLYEILTIEACGNFNYDFNKITLKEYLDVEKSILGNNKLSDTKEDALEREIYVILYILNAQLNKDSIK